ncbi:MAG: tetratricopeptide repeat protein [Bacteroidetes bacterium]|nr:MAG: tetratricopeptide repeat protein [Bacteroidota bacterium]
MFEENEEEFDRDFREDIERFERSLQGEEFGFMDADRIEMLVDHYLIHSSYSKAATCCDIGISQFPFNHIFLLRKAQALSAQGKLKEALGLLNEYEQTSVIGCEFNLTKASIFSQLKDSKRAIRYFREALNDSDIEDKDEIYLDLAMEYQQQGDYQSAIQVLQEAIHQNPKNEGAIYELAYCYDHTKEIEKAIKCYSDFIDENPYSFTAWYNLGNAYSKEENYEKAIWAYDYCIVINESFSPAYFNLGNACLSLERYQTAIEYFEKCMELDGEDGLALCYIGECQEQLGNLELARHYYLRSIEFIPELPEAWLGLGIVKDLEGQTEDAIQLIRKAIDFEPTNGSFRHVLAGAYEKLELLDEAEEAYLLAIELDPENEDIFTDYVEFLSEQNSLIDALHFTEKSEFPESMEFVKNLCRVNILWQLNRKEEALSTLIYCISEDEKRAKHLFTLYPELQNESKIVNLFAN